MTELQCYNKGCGAKFNPENNKDGACTYHPGVPVFHDALKGWSCCEKRSTDFTQFLNFPGCTQGKHSNEKPVEPEKQKKEESSNDVIVVEAPPTREPIKPRDESDRPPVDEPLMKLKVTVGSTLKTALEKLSLESNNSSESVSGEPANGEIEVGTSCKNNACKATYQGESSNSETCMYHPGVPIFHEGMKYWSCCQRKTSDFDTFLAQAGCESGTHKWTKPKSAGGEVKLCRFDWHQTGPVVCLSVFSKAAVPDLTVIEANKVFLKVHIAYEGGKSIFSKEFILRDVIIPEQSVVKMLGTKVEINLRKAESFKWPTLELPKAST